MSGATVLEKQRQRYFSLCSDTRTHTIGASLNSIVSSGLCTKISRLL